MMLISSGHHVFSDVLLLSLLIFSKNPIQSATLYCYIEHCVEAGMKRGDTRLSRFQLNRRTQILDREMFLYRNKFFFYFEGESSSPFFDHRRRMGGSSSSLSLFFSFISFSLFIHFNFLLHNKKMMMMFK
jgi:hypothetical protein